MIGNNLGTIWEQFIIFAVYLIPLHYEGFRIYPQNC